MTRNNLLFKILFAIELALLPMVIFAKLLLTNAPWAMGVFVAGILLAKIWLHIFNDKTKSSTVIISIGNILVFAVLLILFMATGMVPIALGVIVLVLITLQNIFKIALYNKSLNETVEAVDYCYTLFECLTLIAFTVIMVEKLLIISKIGLFAIILTSALAVIYKIYYTIRYTNFISSLKNLFRRK